MWHGNQMHCDMSNQCAAGKYAVLKDNGAIDHCVPCPLNTFSSSAQMVYNPRLTEQCTPCPLNFKTMGTGSSDISMCSCNTGVNIRAQGNQSAVCGQCQNNTWYNYLTQKCVTCPTGMVATSSGCACSTGDEVGPVGACVKCSLGFYSMGVSVACTACPPGRTTTSVGQSWCVCASTGSPPRMGICL